MNDIILDSDFIDKICYINLNKRPGRDKRLREELNKLHIADHKIIRFEAIEADPGYIGCAKSHKAVLEIAQEEKWRNVLILEDDMVFNHTQEHIAVVNSFFSMLKENRWDVAMLAANYYGVEPFVSNSSFFKVEYAHCACAYIVNGDYYSTLIENISEAITNLENGGSQTSFSLDAYWRRLVKKDLWFGVYPNFGYQQSGVSDIQNTYMNYERLFLKPLEQISIGTYYNG
ncbi:glycosyltransferase family 25 protein [Enterobacteriaceae bacterium H16N7]|nr:glycosyltransferase family 25 protein [Dryocola clanedunensis]